jgi:hypothetical protein
MKERKKKERKRIKEVKILRKGRPQVVMFDHSFLTITDTLDNKQLVRIITMRALYQSYIIKSPSNSHSKIMKGLTFHLLTPTHAPKWVCLTTYFSRSLTQ